MVSLKTGFYCWPPFGSSARVAFRTSTGHTTCPECVMGTGGTRPTQVWIVATRGKNPRGSSTCAHAECTGQSANAPTSTRGERPRVIASELLKNRTDRQVVGLSTGGVRDSDGVAVRVLCSPATSRFNQLKINRMSLYLTIK